MRRGGSGAVVLQRLADIALGRSRCPRGGQRRVDEAGSLGGMGRPAHEDSDADLSEDEAQGRSTRRHSRSFLFEEI